MKGNGSLILSWRTSVSFTVPREPGQGRQKLMVTLSFSVKKTGIGSADSSHSIIIYSLFVCIPGT